MTPLEFTVDGKAVPKARPRFDRRSGRAYTPTTSKAYERRVAAEAWHATRWETVDGRKQRRAEKWPNAEDCGRTKRRATRRKSRATCNCAFCRTQFAVSVLIILPDRRTRDLDNIVKSVMDALNGIVWHDDSQVVKLATNKEVNRDRPRVEVTIAAVVAQGQLNMNPEKPKSAAGPVWDEDAAKDFVRQAKRWTLKQMEQELAATFVDIWTVGFLEGVDAGPGAKPPTPKRKPHLRLVRDTEGHDDGIL